MTGGQFIVRRHVVKKLLVLVVATAVALAIGELLVRGLCHVPDVKPIWLSSSNCVYRRSGNPVLSYELKPNYRSDKPNLKFDYESTNSHGQRDVERRLQKQPGTSRVILLGDSVVEGHGIRETDTISRQLEKALAPENVEVLNFGVSGYCTRSEVELLEVKGLAFAPDVVVLVFVENDFDHFNHEFDLLERDRPTAVKYMFLYSHLFRKAALDLNLFGFGFDADPARWNRRAVGENNVVSGLRRLSQLSRQHGFRTLVAVWPAFGDAGIMDTHFMPGGSQDLIVERLCRMNGIPVSRLSEDFRHDFSAAPGPASARLLYTIGDGMHPSPRGSSVAAQALKARLQGLKQDAYAPAKGDNPQSGTGDDPEAIAAAAALGDREPNNSEVYNNLGRGLAESGEPERAVEYFKMAIQEDPDNGLAHFNWATALNILGRPEEAISQFQEALRIDPNSAEVHYSLGNTWDALGHPQEALVHYHEALRIVPTFVAAHINCGNALVSVGRPEEAMSHYQEAIRIQPDCAEAHVNWGATLKALGKLQDAVKHYQEAVRIKPDFAEAHFSLGNALAVQGRLRDAAEEFQQALRIKPDYPAARENLRLAREQMQEKGEPRPIP